MGKRIARAGLAGFLIGILVLGLGGRLAMRLVAILIHQTTHFGFGATLGIIVIGGVLGTLAGLAYGIMIERTVPMNAAAKGTLYGTVLFVVLVLFQPPAIRAEVTAARDYWWAIIPLFWVVCLAYAVTLATALDRRSTQTIGV